MKRNFWTGFVCVVVALTMALGTVAIAAGKTKGVLSTDEINDVVNTTTDASLVSSPFTQVAEAVRPSVVGVNNYQMYSNRYYYGYGRNYGGNQATEQLAGTGSGVVVTQYGHILTNYHVVENASRLTVTIAASEEEMDAVLVAYDENADLAVLHVNNLPLAPVPMGDSDQLQVGEWAIVVGNPLGEDFARTLTVGVVSALDREVTDTAYDRYGRRTNVTNTMIQVDAAINPGNSGGGMFNTLGQLMGIPARKYSSNGFSSSASIENIGMCIPINVAKPLIREALESYTGDDETAKKEDGTAASSNKPRMGVTVSTLNTNGTLPAGAFIRVVDDNSNANAAGLLPGDIIVEMDGEVISSSTQCVEKVQSYEEGAEIAIKVYRAPGLQEQAENSTIDMSKVEDGEYIDLTLTLLLRAKL